MIPPFFKTSVGKKVIVGLTGLVMYGFVVGHMVGNLQVFGGPAMLNDYAAFLRNTHGLLWVTRVVLLASVLLHVVFTVQLTRANRASRPIGYVEQKPVQATLSSRIMIWSGAFLGFYIVYHILHLTLGTVHPDFNHQNVYANVIIGFSSVPAAMTYIVAMIALGLHLNHGVSSVFQTLGFNHPRYNGIRRALAVGSAVIVSAGFISIPVAVLLGILKL